MTVVLIKAQLRHLHIPPRKARFVVDTIRGLSVNEAEVQLMTQSRRPAPPLLKLLRSAIANAKNNHHIEAANLYIKEIKVDGGPKTKRFRPRAFGRVNLIEKKTSHVTLVLGVSEKPQPSRFVIHEKPKKEKKKKKEKEHKHEHEEETTVKKEKEEKERPGVKPSGKPSVFRRFFRRKSV